ncbi:hypothetical protein ACIBL6_03550 [Streptomyces sp. NPDC050400]|uniref:hypothetical protein n=1 Tax=Streptomyces sp. NPDC050400 TaxID=3365610 RepID=UPI00378E22F6
MTPRAAGRRGRVLAGVGLAAAAVLCGVGTWSYAQARGDDDLAYGRARDAALDDGRSAVAALSTLDASTKDRARTGVTHWRTVTTGPLRTQLGRVAPAAGASSRGVVTDAAVTALDDRAGTAKLIATVRVDTTPKGTGSATSDRKRLEATLARTSDGTWKVKSLSAVPVTGVTG